MKKDIAMIQGGVTTANGFQAAGAHIGLRKKRKDLALVLSDVPCDWAATFTTNTMKAAPIVWNQSVMQSGSKVKALVVNSACANSCTGVIGELHAKEMAVTTAEALSLNAEEVLVSSTGVIGTLLPIALVKKGIKMTAPSLGYGKDSALHAAEAITTTDTFTKQAAVQFHVGNQLITLGAMAKGSGMVHPNMATMLAFITTDLNIDQALLQKALSGCVKKTFNMISVDGDTSTNDMVVVLANGTAGNEKICVEDQNYAIFAQALEMLTTHLAKLIASDGEGATKLLEVTVSGAASEEDAAKLAKFVVSSNLVKVAFFAEDANWGRIVGAMGAAGINFDFNKLALSISGDGSDVGILVDGMPYWLDEQECKAVLESKEIRILIELGEGDATSTAWGCDLTFDYIQKGGAYRRDHGVEQPTAAPIARGGVA